MKSTYKNVPKIVSIAFVLLLRVGQLMGDSTPIAITPTVGYFPSSFPRDPVDVNVFTEHVILGQVLEPLVQSGTDGNIIPAVAESWKIEEGGRKITFIIRAGLNFSDGRSLRAEDVKYTLDRHIVSAHSQSKAYLQRIKTIAVLSSNSICLTLDAPYVAIFKALSRDQLGIVPSGWKFNPKSQEPFIGTGPYRVIRNADGWHFEVNKLYRDISKIRIPKWDLVFMGAEPNKLAAGIIPDLIPFATPDIFSSITKNSNWTTNERTSNNLLHFVQSSAWWYPHGQSYLNKGKRLQGMTAMKELLQMRTKSLGLRQASGVFPEGIPGYIAPTSQGTPAAKSPSATCKPLHLHVGILEREFTVLNGCPEVQLVEKQHCVKFDFFSFKAPEIPNLKVKRPDIVVFAYAGGFQDPEGFLTVLTASLSSDLSGILGEAYASYLEAAKELDWEVRAHKYQKLNAELLSRSIMVPGWRPDIFEIIRSNLTRHTPSFSYSPKLEDFGPIHKGGK